MQLDLNKAEHFFYVTSSYMNEIMKNQFQNQTRDSKEKLSHQNTEL